jgi:hypothetical protein
MNRRKQGFLGNIRSAHRINLLEIIVKATLPKPVNPGYYFNSLLDLGHKLDRILKWFSKGLKASSKDDKFIYFWFVLEQMVSIDKSKDKVSDKCQKCRSDLYCHSCNSISTHKPFPKQSIERLFKDNLGDDYLTIYEKAETARNRLSHGDHIDEIEKEDQIDFVEITNNLGQLAWHVLMKFYLNKTSNDIHFIDKAEYVNYQLRFISEICAKFEADYKFPDPKTFPKVKVEAK